MWKKTVLAYLWYSSSIDLEGLRKAKKTLCQDNRSQGPKFKSRTFKI
jgi:hypothetical protein